MYIFSFSQCPQTNGGRGRGEHPGAKGCSREKKALATHSRKTTVGQEGVGVTDGQTPGQFLCKQLFENGLPRSRRGGHRDPISFWRPSSSPGLHWRAVHRVLPPPSPRFAPRPSHSPKRHRPGRTKGSAGAASARVPGEPRLASAAWPAGACASLSGRRREG